MLGLQLYNYTSKLIKDPIYLLEFVDGKGARSSKVPQRSVESPIWKCFWKMVLCSHLWSALYFVFFPLSQFNLYAASILLSILLNRLQCVLLSAPLSLYLTGCGSPGDLNHIQVSVPCRCMLQSFGANSTKCEGNKSYFKCSFFPPTSQVHDLLCCEGFEVRRV